MTASKSLDGYSFDHYRARFSGTADLEDREAQAAALDETLVMVIVARVSDVQAKMDQRGDTKGDLSRVAVCKVTDARVIDDPALRQTLVDSLGLYGTDTTPVSLFTEGVEVAKTDGYLEPLAHGEDVSSVPLTDNDWNRVGHVSDIVRPEEELVTASVTEDGEVDRPKVIPWDQNQANDGYVQTLQGERLRSVWDYRKTPGESFDDIPVQ